MSLQTNISTQCVHARVDQVKSKTQESNERTAADVERLEFEKKQVEMLNEVQEH